MTLHPPYSIERILPKYLFDEIRHLREKYDVIFIDVPRLTEGNEDSNLSTAITYCDYLLIPIVAGDLEALSTVEFIKLVQDIDKYKSEKGFFFKYYGFLNKRNRRSENDQAVEFMKKLKVPMFATALPDVKILSKPQTFESVMDTKEGEGRFAEFFQEFTKKIKV